ncbi:MAG: hypothetical protein K6F00_06745 [Lachnospiraceae bacterium]|nr:hypothetical protein [Lachnospiraceae bacterium]
MKTEMTIPTDKDKKFPITRKMYEEKLNYINEIGYFCCDWYPTMKDVDELAKDPEGNFDYILWVLKSNPDRKLTREQKKVEESLKKILRPYVNFSLT